MPIRTIVFDFGNVVGFFDHRRACRNLARYTDQSPEALYASMMGGSLEDDYESGRITSAEFTRQVRELCRLRCSDAEFAAHFGDIFWPNEDVIRLLPLLKPRYRLLLGSNTCELHAIRFKEQFADALGYFDALVLSFEIGVRKPKPGFFEHAQQKAGSAPQECVFIDDLPANVAGAVACGWHGIVYRDRDELVRNLNALGVRL